ncbi:MAG TPA: RecQ family ATP-dependent DNA helicase [Solirubrobacteraceae bacterium]|jgi:ATP-dependent DNA helicase RecQ|nr:RecQ family ATP-dependent DNA helicase [Solirubrobacteraceae bacterium]
MEAMTATAPARDVDERSSGAPTPEELLARFGLQRFRPGQREAVQAALDGRDSLVVMPTGGGKSLCYQLPALASDQMGGGLVVVVSPLIALMSDQWRRLQGAGVRAAMLASGMQDGHNARALRDIEAGDTQLVLAAPERFASGAFRAALARRRVALFVVDEAHCVAEWGHDFRPDYLRLHDAIASLGRPAVMAATATATPRVADEIAARLGLRDWVSIRSGFDRPNLTFDVVGLEGKGAVARKRAALTHALTGGSGAGGALDPGDSSPTLPAIVYCGTRKDTDEVADGIRREGIATVTYHAGMSPDARRESQAAFMEGRAQVVVATNAFGMGVDKADVRTVAHWALPTSLEAYYQEAGRGGRDGEPARALLLASRMDLGRLIRFIKEREMTVEDVKRYVASLRHGAEDGTVTIGHGELGERQRVLLSVAERAGAVELQPGGRDGLLVTLTGAGSPRRAQMAIQAARNRGWEAYRSIERYSAEGQTCRRRQILDHFGDRALGAPTGRCCDVCDPDTALEQALRAAPTTSARRRAGAGAGAGSGGLLAGGAGSGGRGRSSTAAEEEGLEPVDEREFDQLRAWRLERSEGKPAYTVATDAALRALLRGRPRSVAALLEVRGIGPAFCEKHGEALLAALWG